MSHAPSSLDRSPVGSAELPRHGMNRWMILAGYGLLAASTQLLWLTFAPITTQTARVMHVSSGATGDLAIIFPFVYIVLGLPTGRWLDGSFRRALTTGAALTAAGALIRLAVPDSFTVQLAGQIVIAAGQPLVLNAITKIAAQHFPKGERATAISIGSVSLFLGILAAMLTGWSAVRRRRYAIAPHRAGRPRGHRRRVDAGGVPHAGYLPGQPLDLRSSRVAEARSLHVGACRSALCRDGYLQRGRHLARDDPRPLPRGFLGRQPRRAHDVRRHPRSCNAASDHRLEEPPAAPCCR